MKIFLQNAKIASSLCLPRRCFSTAQFPSKTTQAYRDASKRFSANNYEPVPVVFAKAQGAKVIDIDGKEYFDFLAAYSAVNQGHCHPKIVDAVKTQLDSMTLSSRAFLNDKFVPFCKLLCEVFSYERALLMNTGVEGGESAVKLARRWGYRSKGIKANEAIVVFASDNFWGRTLAAISSSTDPTAYEDFGPFMPGFEIVEYDNLQKLRALFEEKGKDICAYMLEPIQGEAGVKLPTEGYLSGVRDLCSEFNILMIADEVQTGLGRTGKMLACDHENVRPDIVILGKALSGGVYPVSAVLADDSIMKHFTPGSHGSTYGGNSLACAAGIASIEVLLEESLCEKSWSLGERFRDQLKPLSAQVPAVKEVRGKGLMNAVVIKGEKTAWDLTLLMAEKGLLAKPTHGDIIRFTPPLVIQQNELETATEIIKESVRELFLK